MFGAVLIAGDERQVDVGAHHAGQVNLRLFGSLFQALVSHAVLFKVDAVFFLKVIDDPVDDALVEIIAAETVVAVGGQHFKHAVADFQQTYVERAAAKVVHQNFLAALLVQTIGQRRGGRLVDDTKHFQTGDTARILGGLALAVTEVGGHGDNRLGHFIAQIGFRVGLQLLQDHRADFLRGIALAVNVHLMVGAHFTLDGNDRTVGVGDGLTFGNLAHQPLAVFGKGDDGRRSTRAFRIGDYNGLAAFQHGDAAVGCAKVNTDNFAHNGSSSKSVYRIRSMSFSRGYIGRAQDPDPWVWVPVSRERL